VVEDLEESAALPRQRALQVGNRWPEGWWYFSYDLSRSVEVYLAQAGGSDVDCDVGRAVTTFAACRQWKS
jgi:hypothetical protein